MPIGKPSAEPKPHKAAPTTATAGTGAVMKHPMPAAAHNAETRRAPTRPIRCSTEVPSRRVTVVATTNTQNVRAPISGETWCPVTIASDIQSFAAPLAKDMPSTSRPISTVRRSRQPPRVAAVAGEVGSSPRRRCGESESGMKRTTNTVTATMTDATTRRCRDTATCSAVAAAPTPAPRTPPRLNMAWNHGMIARRRERSIATASTFIATLQVPVPNPSTASPAKIPTGVAPATASAVTALPRLATHSEPRIAWRAESRAAIRLASTNPATEPTDSPSESTPMTSTDKCS
jgi:hypothetical protein